MSSTGISTGYVDIHMHMHTLGLHTLSEVSAVQFTCHLASAYA